eukprot:CAMPEP_0113638412 /NCGR_PEP_ID=MMETSP0017_2-20120614/20121_1 /TAXON_ID=2856 /ORGANISM="Cylindrotheca closterium" /LENGTH=168 /DNA_ID=CAMNT_0000549515 /DNA_START=660 /DNA_END=1166 /DNA_ORIENTATION=- /assembly_acc=CAM_ASM_000147
MDHLHLPLRTPKRRLRAMPVLRRSTIEENESSSSSSSVVVVRDSTNLSAFALAPRRNYKQELETRTLRMRTPMDEVTSKKLEFPTLLASSPPPDKKDEEPQEEEAMPIPKLSLKRKRRFEDKDIIIIEPSRKRPTMKLKGEGDPPFFFRPIVVSSSSLATRSDNKSSS